MNIKKTNSKINIFFYFFETWPKNHSNDKKIEFGELYHLNVWRKEHWILFTAANEKGGRPAAFYSFWGYV